MCVYVAVSYFFNLYRCVHYLLVAYVTVKLITVFIAILVHYVCFMFEMFSALSHRVNILEMSVIIIIVMFKGRFMSMLVVGT